MREWELSYRLGMRPWICVAYSAPVAAATAVFLIYPIGQGSFSDGRVAVFSILSFKQMKESFLKKKSYLNKGRSALKRSKNVFPFGMQSTGDKREIMPNLLTVAKLLNIDNVEQFENNLPKGIRGFDSRILAENPLRNSTLNLPLTEVTLQLDTNGNPILIDLIQQTDPALR